MAEQFEIFVDYELECAHSLPQVAPGHKCARTHGHSYQVRLYVGGPLDAEMGWIRDYAEIDAVWHAKVHAALDHQNLNEIKGLENPTCEHIARWIWQALDGLGLTEIVVHETRRAGVRYRG